MAKRFECPTEEDAEKYWSLYNPHEGTSGWWERNVLCVKIATHEKHLIGKDEKS